MSNLTTFRALRVRTPLALVVGAVGLTLAAAALPLRGPATGDAAGAGIGAGRSDAPTFAGSVAPAAFACTATLTAGGVRHADADRPTGGAMPPALERLRAALYAPDRFDRASGSGVRTACRDADAPYAITWHFDLEQLERVRTLDGTLVLNAFESRHTVVAPRATRAVDDTVVGETVSLPDIAAWRPAADGDGLVAARSARRAGAGARACGGIAAGRCSARLDIGWRLRAAGEAVSVEQTFWVGGRAAERVTWRLEV